MRCAIRSPQRHRDLTPPLDLEFDLFLASGALGVLSIFNAVWIVPAAIAMAIFYALAGGKHVLNAERTSSENWAMGSDLWAAAVLVGWLGVVQ